MVTDVYLIWQFNRGRREALHRIYERYKDDLVTLAAALLMDKDLAEDVVHDVFIGFIRSQSRFRLTGSLKAYLSTCVANAARNRNKAEGIRRHTPLDIVAPPPAPEGDPGSLAIFGEESRRLTRAMQQLPYEQREVLVLRVYSDMKFTAIAAQQGTSLYTAQGRYRYALEKMQKLLAEDKTPPTNRTLKLHQGTG